MAVYTTLNFDDINRLVQRFSIGELIDFEGIATGMENTNYFVTTSFHHLATEQDDQVGKYVLTLFEELPESELPFHIELLQLLEQQQIPVAAPINDIHGYALQKIKTLPAVLCPRLTGQHPVDPSVEQCKIIGSTLAAIHQTCEKHSFKQLHTGIRGTQWLQESQ